MLERLEHRNMIAEQSLVGVSQYFQRPKQERRTAGCRRFTLQATLNHGKMMQGETLMNTESPSYAPSYPPIPPSYEECVAAPAHLGPRVQFAASPLAVAEFLDWDDEDD
jgi:hypothetical protein